MESLEVAVLEPYYGGSHAAFVDAFCRYSAHRCHLVTLPARKWKWRMRGAAAWFARHDTAWISRMSAAAEAGRAVLFTNDMLSVADLRALLPPDWRRVPIVVYFHENQLSYPLPDESTRDYQFGMTNILSCLAADGVWFNSHDHLETFLAAADRLLAKMPDHVPAGIVENVRLRAVVLAPPVDIPPAPSRARRNPPVILWPHRWEYDKNPRPFFEALVTLHAEGKRFRLVLLGEQFREAPAEFRAARRTLAEVIDHCGYVDRASGYLEILRRCDLVVSTAIHETFGLAVAESILGGCQPLLPRRLSYPEMIPQAFHGRCLYDGDDELMVRLRDLIRATGWLEDGDLEALKTSLVQRFGLPGAVQRLDSSLEAVWRQAGGRG